MGTKGSSAADSIWQAGACQGGVRGVACFEESHDPEEHGASPQSCPPGPRPSLPVAGPVVTQAVRGVGGSQLPWKGTGHPPPSLQARKQQASIVAHSLRPSS